jgi:outer membrane protein assembly factor BamB
MATAYEAIRDIKAAIDGLCLVGAGPDKVADYVQGVKKRLKACRAAFEKVPENRFKGVWPAASAALDFLRIAYGETLHLVKHPLTQASPLAAEINDCLTKIREIHGRLVTSLLKAARTMDFAPPAGEISSLFIEYENLICRKLAVAHRRQIPDYFAGLDLEAVFPSYRYSAANRGRVSRPGLAKGGNSAAWSVKIGGLIWPSVIIDRNGRLYTGHADGEFVALGPGGEEEWRIHDPRMMYIDSTGALGRDGFLYMASTDVDERGNQNRGRIWKINPATGDVVWTFEGRHFEDPETNPRAHLSSFFEGNISLGYKDGRIFVYAGSDDNFLYKLDENGNLVWEYDTGGYPAGVIWTKPLLSEDGNVVYIGDLAGCVHALRTSDGARLWRCRLGGSVVSSLAMGMYGEIFLGCFDGKIYALDPDDGTVFWHYQTLGLIYSSPAVAENGDVVIGSSDGAIYCLDRFGRRQWTYRTDAPVKSSPAIGPDGLIYVGNQNGRMYCLRFDGRRLWSLHTNPGITENDINSSPTIGSNGEVYFGSTTGEVFCLPADYYFNNSGDERLCLDPKDDGGKPPLKPGEACVVFLDSSGTPVFGSPSAVPVTGNLDFALFAVNDNLDVIPSEMISDTIRVEISPSLKHDMRVESMGRYIYIIPSEFLEYDTEYNIRASGKYKAAGIEKPFESEISLRTAARGAAGKMFLRINRDAVDGIVFHNTVIRRPKEVDALGQAMADSMNFAVAPIYIDEKKNLLVAAVSIVVRSGGRFEYSPATVNRFFATGSFRDGSFMLRGSLRLIAQGANIPFEEIILTGRFDDKGQVWESFGVTIAPVSGMPDFAELIRVMRLADIRDDVVGCCSFSASPFESHATVKSEGLEILNQSLSMGFVKVEFKAPNFNPREHYVGVAFIDRDSGELIGSGGADVEEKPDGAFVVKAATSDNGRSKCVAIIVLDLFPAAVVESGGEKQNTVN